MIEKTRFWIFVIAVFVISGCSSAPEVAPVVEPSPPPVNVETIRALNELTEIKEEMKQLRNLVEEMQFNNENSRRQHSSLLESLTQRVSGIEQTQQEIGLQGTVELPQGVEGAAEEDIVSPGSEEAVEQLPATQEVVATETFNEASNTIIPPAGASSGTVTLNEQQSYDNAFELLKQSLYEDAIHEFQLLADTWPEGGLADDAYYWMSEARYVNREFESAIVGFRTVVTRYPESPRVPEALLKIGYIQYDVGSYEDAAETFRNILAQFPGHQVAVSAKTRLRRIEKTIQ
ncbi:MAG: tol-pal system protein YbgF [Gammaproteobacteria bacterium]|nr:tol-pal system protein YbgF [Gammaproteobacteria bacterium]